MILWGPILEKNEPEELFTEYNENNKWTLACGHLIDLRHLRHPSGALVFDLNGVWLGLNYNVDERQYNFMEEFKSCRKPALIILSSSDKAINNSVLQIVLKYEEKQVYEIPGIHGFEPELVEQVINYSADWLESFVPLS